jgi:hypothetical protein
MLGDMLFWEPEQTKILPLCKFWPFLFLVQILSVSLDISLFSLVEIARLNSPKHKSGAGVGMELSCKAPVQHV